MPVKLGGYFIFTGPPTHSIGGQYCFARWHPLSSSSSVTLHSAYAT